MKTRKILASLLAVSSLGTVASIAGCSCGNKDADPTIDVDPSTPKDVEVTSKTEIVYYKFSTKGFPSPEKTDAVLSNLYVNDAPATEVTSLLTHTLQDNFIVCAFNLKAAIKELNAQKINFDIKFTDQQTNWEKTVTGFSIKVDRKASAVTYGLTNGIELTKAPEIIYSDEDLDVEFKLKPGYEYLSDECDIKVNETSIKSEEGVTIDLENGKIHVPSTYIGEECTIAITLKADGKTYTISTLVDEHVKLGDVSSGIKHAEEGSLQIDCDVDPYYQFAGNVIVKDDVTEQEVEGCKVENKKLIIPCASVVNNITITASTEAKKYDIKLGDDVPDVIHFTSAKVDHDNAFNGQITCNDGYTLNSPVSVTFNNEAGEAETKSINLDDQGNFSIDAGEVKGDVILNPTVNGKTYNIHTTSIKQSDYIEFVGAGTVVHPENYTATIKPKDDYHTFNPGTNSWDCKLGGATGESLKEFITWNGDVLTVQGDKILGDLYFSATAVAKSWDVALDRTSASHITTETVKKATWGEAYSVELDIDDNQYTYEIENATCKGVDIKTKVSFTKKQDENKYTLTIDNSDKTTITGAIAIKFKQTPKQYTITKPSDSNIKFTGNDKATHDADYTATVTVNDTEKFKVNDNSISIGSLVRDRDYTFTVQESDKYTYDLRIKGSKINSDLTISVTTEAATFDYEVSKDTGFTSITPTSGTATHGTNLELTYVLEPGKKVDPTNTKCVVTSPKGGTTTLKIGSGITDDGNGKFTIDGSKITGSLAFDGVTANVVYTVSAGTTTGFGISGTPTTTYNQPVDIPLTIATDYVLNTNDFIGNTPNITLMMGGSPLTYGTDFSVTTTEGSENIHINEGVVKDNITLSGEVTQYKVKSTQTGSAFSSLPTSTATKNQAFSVTATLASGYADSTVGVSCGTTTFTQDSDYTVSTNGTTVTVNVTATEKIIGPITMTFAAVNTPILFIDSQNNLAIGDTSTTYVAKTTTTGASASIALESTTATGTTFANNKLTAGNKNGKAILKATYQGSTKTNDVTISTPGTKLSKTQDAYVGGSIDISYTWDNTYVIPSTEAQNSTVATWISSNPDVADFDTVTTEAGVTTNVLKAKAKGSTVITLFVKYGTLEGEEIESNTLLVEVSESTKKIGFNITSKPEHVVVNGLTGQISPASPKATITAYSDYKDPEYYYKYNYAGYFKFTSSDYPSWSKECEYCVVPYKEDGKSEPIYTLTVDFSDVFALMSEGDEITLSVQFIEVQGGKITPVYSGESYDKFSFVQEPNNIFNVDGKRDVSFSITPKSGGIGNKYKFILSPYDSFDDPLSMGEVSMTETMAEGQTYTLSITTTTDSSKWNCVKRGELYLIVKLI